MSFPIRLPRRAAATAAAAACLLLASCTTYEGPGRLAEIRRETDLERSNFKIARSHVQGQASCLHLVWFQLPIDLASVLGLTSPLQSVGFLAFGNPDLRARAMADLHRQVDLRGKPQFLDGVMEEWSVSSYLGFFATVTVTVSADVIEFTDGPAAAADEARAD